MSRERRLIFILLGLTLLRGLIYAAVVPPWQSPDETGHFEYVWLIAHLGRLPGPEDVSPDFERELLGSLYEWRYGEFIGRPLPRQMPTRMNDLPANIFASRSRTVLSGRFSLAYLWSALFLLPFRHQELVLQLYAARMSEVLLNVAIVWLAFRTFLELMPSHPDLVPWMAMLVVFLPQHTFINSTVGDGPLAELASCLVLYCWARLFHRGLGVGEVIGIVLGTSVGIWSKTTAFFLLPLDTGLALWWLLRQPRQRWTWRYTAYLSVIIVIVGIGIWVWSRSPQGVRALSLLRYFLFPRELFWMDRRGITFGNALLLTYDSFWANFGWMTVPISERWYGAIAMLSVMAIWGWCTGKRRATPFWPIGMMGIALGGAFLIFVWVALLATSSGYYQFQGRYLFPVVIPFAFFLIGGLEHLFPMRENRAGMILISLFLVCLDTWCLAGYILPYFYS